ncbi:MAG: hypothetical protein M1833_006146 [Piccolia ochrophora]|nr:MAG: hypothetical protein M1833_006146 [Piccolia ochrophora]
MGRPKKRARSGSQPEDFDQTQDSFEADPSILPSPGNTDTYPEWDAPVPEPSQEAAREIRLTSPAAAYTSRGNGYFGQGVFSNDDFDMTLETLANTYDDPSLASPAHLERAHFIPPSNISNTISYQMPLPSAPPDPPDLAPFTLSQFNSPAPSTLPSPPQSCSCFRSLCDTLSSLSTFSASPPTPQFPFALAPLQNALKTAQFALVCTICRHPNQQAFQTMMLLATLIPIVANGYAAILAWVDDEARSVQIRGEKKKLRMGDAGPTAAAMHTGQPDCAAGWEVEVDAAEWRRLARRVVRERVYGGVNGDVVNGSEGRLGLMQILQMMEQKQREGHEQQSHAPRDDENCSMKLWRGNKGEDPFCAKLLGHVKEIVGRLEVDE